MTDDASYKVFTHNPPHLFMPGASYMITGATYQKLPHMLRDERKTQRLDAFRFVLSKERWQLVAYVVMSNHYHTLLQAPDTGADRLSAMIMSLHRFTARPGNDADHTPGRVVWWNYWDTCLTNDASCGARINYIHWNPVRHGVATQPDLYEFSTYRTWQLQWDAELQRLEREYPFDRVSVYDDF